MTMRRLAGVAVLGESLRGVMTGFVEDSKVAVVPNGTPEFTASSPTRGRLRLI